VGLLITGSVAVERVASGHHFPTDVTVAAVAGTAVGLTVPWLHFRRGDTHVQIAPLARTAWARGRILKGADVNKKTVAVVTNPNAGKNTPRAGLGKVIASILATPRWTYIHRHSARSPTRPRSSTVIDPIFS